MNRFRIALCSLFALAPAFAPFARAGDFNGDGFDDLAIGEPHALIAGIDCGAVHVLYGTAAGGLDVAGGQVLSPADIQHAIEPLVGFGRALAVGDFDGDGRDDLAVAAPDAGVGSVERAGIVYEFRGTELGLVFRRAWHQNRDGVKDKCEPNESFGTALAAADFDGDGRDDLAAGVRETIAGQAFAGAVHVLYGSSDGLDQGGDQVWHQNRDGIKDKAEENDHFGDALAAGDVNGDGHADLAAGVPYENRWHAGVEFFGAAAVLLGSPKGLSADGDVLVDAFQLGGGSDMAETGFGLAVTIGDFDGDGRGDLAVGAPAADLSGHAFAGVVFVARGAPKGLALGSAEIWSQDSEHVAGSGNEGDQFGAALAAGDFDGDGRADLAVGVPGDQPVNYDKVGAVAVLKGSPAGLTGLDSMRFYQLGSAGGLLGTPEEGDAFGSALACGDFDGDGTMDLGVGVPYEDVGSSVNAGCVNVLYGADSSGLGQAGNQIWYEATFPGPGIGDAHEAFGSSLGG